MLAQNYARLDDEVGKLDREMKNIAREFSGRLESERAAREKADMRNDQQLKEAVVGRIHLDLAGVLYLVLGILAGTASLEFARLLGAAPCPSEISPALFGNALQVRSVFY